MAGGRIRQRTSIVLGVVLAVLAGLGALGVAVANGSIVAISGATSWGTGSPPECTWYTSENLRYTTVSNKQVRVRLSDTGKLGVKMRSLNVNTGLTSAIAYYPPLNVWQNLGKYSAKGTPFRLQFTCQNPRNPNDNPSTDFSGSLDS